MKIKFCVELDITNIKFHACFAMIVGFDVTFPNKNCHMKLEIRKIELCTFFEVKLALIRVSSLQFKKRKENKVKLDIRFYVNKNETNIQVSFVLLERAM